MPAEPRANSTVLVDPPGEACALVILLALVLVASVWGGMAWKGGPNGTPRSFHDFWDRLTQQPAKEQASPKE